MSFYSFSIVVLFIFSFYSFNSTFLSGGVLCDVARPWQLGFQDPATPVAEGIISLHHHIMFFIILVVTFVTYILLKIIISFNYKSNPVAEPTPHSVTLEVIWTLIPSVILLFIAIPSFALLYSMDDVIDPTLTVKCVGRQWFWHYEYSDYKVNTNPTDLSIGESLSFDSYMVAEDDLNLGDLRLLEVDNRLVLPTNTHICFVVTSTDVIHAFAVPSLGIKIDCVPGRLNQVSCFLYRTGIFYGQCSELCGANHAFMPIVVEAVSLEDYVEWVKEKLAEQAV